MASYTIRPLPNKKRFIKKAAKVLVDGFRVMAPDAWPTKKDARAEINDILSEDENVLLAAIDAEENVLGWIGGIPEYDYAWELHPLVVAPEAHGLGIGRKLVEALESEARKQGVLTIYLGTDDTKGFTTLSTANLYENLQHHIDNIENLGDYQHPFGFYQRLGYKIVGVIPDANGKGKPDIFMAKSL